MKCNECSADLRLCQCAKAESDRHLSGMACFQPRTFAIVRTDLVEDDPAYVYQGGFYYRYAAENALAAARRHYPTFPFKVATILNP